MDSERWQQCKQVFQAALDLPAAERAAYVQQACGDDDELRLEVTSLLESEEKSNQFLSEAAANYVDLPGDGPETARLPAGEVLAGRYRIARLIGSGGMGEVYEAEDLELRAPVALKLVRPEIAVQHDILERFKREVLLARQVTHPNVCRIFDLGFHGGGPRGRMIFLTMELLAGETLADRIEHHGPMRASDALPIVQQLTAGLAAAHRAGVIHRDFKSGNVILAPEEDGLRVKIMDFGLARAVSGGDSARTTLTVAGGLIGTPAYMAPEQIEGGEITAATDIYALGVVMYEMVTGKLPFSGESPWIVATKRLREAPSSPRTLVPTLDRTWETVILRCLERNSASRYAGAADVGRALTGEAVAPSAVSKVAVSERRPRAAIALLALVLAALAAAYYWFTYSHRTPPASDTAQFGWRPSAIPADLALAQIVAAAGSIDPLQVTLFGGSFARSWIPGQPPAAPMPTTFAPVAQAQCSAGIWMIHDDNRHLTRWDPAKQKALATIALPWPVKSAACLDEKAARWGFLADDGGASRWIEFDAAANRTLHTYETGDRYLEAVAAPGKQAVALIATGSISIRNLPGLEEIFHDTLGEKLLGHPAAAWSESGRYLGAGFKQLAIYDIAAKKRIQTLATTGWTSGIGWIGDTGISAMDERGRLYWTADLTKDWQLKQEAPAQTVYQPFWIPSQYRWLALGKQGQAIVWEYIAPSQSFDLLVSPLDIWSVAANPAGATAAVAGKDPRIFIVDLQQRKTIRTLEGHTDGVPFVGFAGPDRLVSASDDKTLRLWDTATGKLLKVAGGHESLVNAFSVSPDSRWLVSVSSDNKVKLWQLPGLAFVKDLGTTANGGAAAAFLPDGERLLISDWKGNLTLYQGHPPDWTAQQRFQLGQNVVYMVCPSQDAWWAVVFEGAAQGLWRVPARDLKAGVRLSADPPAYCSTSADGRLTSVQFWNRLEVRSNKDGNIAVVYRFAAKEGSATALSAHPPLAIAGFSDGHLQAWPLAASY